MANPMAAFTHLMAPLETSEIVGLEWLNSPTNSKLKPTRVTDTFEEYKYVVDKGGQINKLFELGDWDREIPGTPWRRGSGSQKLHLSQAAGQRGQTSTFISSVTGKVTTSPTCSSTSISRCSRCALYSTPAQNADAWS
jgi:hypothetical protein